VPATRTKALLVLVAAGTIAVYATAFALSTTNDRPDQIDTDAVVQVATDACIRLRLGVDSLPPPAPQAPLAARRDRVAEQSRLVARLVADVRAVGRPALDADVPTEQWLGDWTALAQAREAYVDGGAVGTFSVPVQDGRPISDRMDAIGVDACRVPDGLKASP